MSGKAQKFEIRGKNNSIDILLSGEYLNYFTL